MKKFMDIERVKHRIKRTQSQIDCLRAKEKGGGSLSVHGRWTLGYYEGKLSMLEELLDYMEEINETIH